MKQNFLITLIGMMGLMLCGCTKLSQGRQDFSWNEDWTFHLGDVADAASVDFDDSDWRHLNVPHDWAIEGTFSKDNPAGTGGGALPGGVGWYRKTFVADKRFANKLWQVTFDGVYMNSEVYLNGHLLGNRPYGYITFSYDLTPYLRYGEPNVLAVRVDNANQPNSRWYSGCGIYRNVTLTLLNPTHIAQWGTYVTTPNVTTQSATIEITTQIENPTQGVQLITQIEDQMGRTVAIATLCDAAPNVTQTIVLNEPQLWSVDSPYIYSIVSILVDAYGKKLDTYRTPFGIRTCRFDSQEGFFLNGKPLKINGVCMHHDLGCLGAAVNRRAIERQLQILKKMGCNAIRTSHNPPAPELLQLCDEMGFIVMDEAFDMWRKRKTTYDYANFFHEWHERDITDFICRDRNHPSVCMWSIGNEVYEQWLHDDADTLSVTEANLLLNFGFDVAAIDTTATHVNTLLCAKLADMVHQLDPTRPITAGCNEPRVENFLFQANALDIIGYNYHEDWFDSVPSRFPNQPFIITESVSALATRGYYQGPIDSSYVWAQRDDGIYRCSAYDNCHVPWGCTHQKSLIDVARLPFVSGQFVWTGFDYLGEPTPFDWPAHSSYFGIVDLAGFPKDSYYLYQSQWSDEDVLHLFPHWNWQVGDTLDLCAYYNHADEVELVVNGTSKGKSRKEPNRLFATWRVPYEPGKVQAIAYSNGKPLRTTRFVTAGVPYAVKLTADRTEISADGTDLSFVTVEVTDENGVLCPWAEDMITFDVQGAAFIAGVDNGNQTSLEPFKADHRKAYFGKCLVVLQNNKQEGDITLTATAAGLKSHTITLKATKK